MKIVAMIQYSPITGVLYGVKNIKAEEEIIRDMYTRRKYCMTQRLRQNTFINQRTHQK